MIQKSTESGITHIILQYQYVLPIYGTNLIPARRPIAQ
jgi:hypothetical protein